MRMVITWKARNNHKSINGPSSKVHLGAAKIHIYAPDQETSYSIVLSVKAHLLLRLSSFSQLTYWTTRYSDIQKRSLMLILLKLMQ